MLNNYYNKSVKMILSIIKSTLNSIHKNNKDGVTTIINGSNNPLSNKHKQNQNLHSLNLSHKKQQTIKTSTV